jgi:hypothetical protein
VRTRAGSLEQREHDDIRLHRDDLAIAINLYNLPLPLPIAFR